jgi:glutathionyl-hydroquinone reductase
MQAHRSYILLILFLVRKVKNNNMVSRTALEEVSREGEFKRKDAVWRNWISREDGAKFGPDKDRYHL